MTDATERARRSAATNAEAVPEVSLARALGLRDLVLFNLVAVLGLRWLATAGKAGPSALVLWGLAPVFFFIPEGLVVTELASRFPQEGGIWASIAFAFAGLELSSAMGGEVKDARRTLPRAVLISAPLIALVYIVGTGALLWLIPTKDINIVSGFLRATAAGARDVSPSLRWLVPFAAAAYTVGNIGGVGAWLTGPARVAFAIGLDRYFPPAFGRVHPKWKTPYVAILVQAGLATVFLLLSVPGKGTTVEKAYLIPLDTQLIVYFIPYVYLFMSFLLLRREPAPPDAALVTGGKGVAMLVGSSGLAVALFAMVVAMIPPGDDAQPALFLVKVVGGALGFVLLSGVVYWLAHRRAPAAAS